MIQYRSLSADELSRELFRGFVRRQTVTKCRRRERGEWVVKDDPFIDDWSEADYETLLSCLRRTVSSGGVVYAAFARGALKGFASVEPDLFGGEQRYLDLSSLHVSQELRGRGTGRVLFQLSKAWARGHGAKKLYISAHSAVETQAFYAGLGCTEAQAYHQPHVDAEPFDCQLECPL